MDLAQITGYFTEYGGIAIFVIVLLEYMNLPGFPAGIIMPLAGIWASQGNIHFLTALLITISAGLVGSWILYGLGYTGGRAFLNAYVRKFPKQRTAVERCVAWLNKKGSIGVFLAKLLPMIRTLISIPAGMIRMNFLKYTVSSVCGIFLWNLLFVGAGYFLGDAVFQYFA